MKKNTNEELVLTVESLANELLSLMGTDARATVYEDKENEAIRVDILTEDETGLLIGRRGETLNSLQAILGMMVKQKTGKWTRVIVNIGDWREKQEGYLRNLAKETAQKAKETGQEQPLYNLSPGQRRIIHLELSNDPEVESLSYGEGEERYLVIKPKEK